MLKFRVVLKHKAWRAALEVANLLHDLWGYFLVIIAALHSDIFQSCTKYDMIFNDWYLLHEVTMFRSSIVAYLIIMR